MTHWQATWLAVTNTVAFSRTTPLPFLVITVKVTELEKVSFSAMRNLKTVC